ncbi:MAG: plastocyanin/azurin family copper-binding protein [Solirubrobacteraceae bacterium]
MQLRPCVTFLTAALAVLALPACGSSSSNSGTTSTTTSTPASKTPVAKTPAGAASTVALMANPSGVFAYNQKSLSATAGKVTIDFTNQAPVPHNVAVAEGSKTLGETPVFNAGTKTLTLTLAKGSYTYFCTVPGHRQQGMEGTLTVS